VFCSCPTTDGCLDVLNSNNNNGFTAPVCSSAPGLQQIVIPGFGPVYIGPYDLKFTTPGTYWVVCTAGDGAHCKNGMKIKVTVQAGSSSTSTVALLQPSPLPQYKSQWGFFAYPTLHVHSHDQIRFRFYSNFHGVATTVPLATAGTDFPAPTDQPANLVRCNPSGLTVWAGIPDAPDGPEGTFTFITFDLSVQQVMGSLQQGSFDVICPASGPSHIPTGPTDTPGHLHCLNGMGFHVQVTP